MAPLARRSAFPRLLIQLVLGLSVSLAAPVASANSVEYTAFSSKYGTYYASYGCNSCHGTSGYAIPDAATNSYGFAFKSAVLARGGRNAGNAALAFTDIEPLDSDGDGYTNLGEIKALTKAYDATSHATASVTLSTSPTSKTGTASSTVSYTVTVTNNGTAIDSFSLAVSVTSGESWVTSIVGTANNIAASGTASITVNVAIPGAASTGQSSTATLTAVSQANGAVSATPLSLTTSIPSVAAIARYVNAVTGSNTSSCTNVASPCKTITYAMAQATAGAPGDAINVAPGTYNAALGEVLPINIKSGVQLFATGATASTIVDATGNNTRVFNASGTNSSTVLQGFTIMGGFHQPPADGSNAEGGALKIDNLSAIKVRRNVFSGNEARGSSGTLPTHPSGGEAYGGAIVSYNSSSTIENNVFVGNTVRGGNGAQKFDSSVGGSAGNGHGGAVWVGGGTATVIINNTFHGNLARGGNGGTTNGTTGGQAGIAFNGAVESNNASVDNNIFVGNSAVAGTPGSPGGSAGNAFNGALSANSAPSTTKNLFFSNTPTDGTTGTAPVFADPQFHSAPSNLRIQLASPANGAGTATGAPTLDFDARVRPSPPSIGAFEASAVAIVSAPELALAQAISPNPASVAKDMIITLTVTNNGAGTATGITLRNTIPGGSGFIWASPGCTHAAGIVTCGLGSLAAASKVVKVVVRPSSVGVAVNAASVSALESDASPGNNSSTFAVTVNATAAGVAVLRYRLYSDVTKEHHFTTDVNEYTVLGTYVGTWAQEGTVGKVLNNPGTYNGVTAVPYYRLYNGPTQWHHWTTDANEYYTLVTFPGWSGEGVDGYILPTATGGATQLFRLNYPALGSLHHWTIDANEYNTLILPAYGWVGEGGAGFVIQ